ncbi:transposase [Endozoicomonas sp. SCSIO W0465]|nr:transposase [Endozoicomonas sp. SCSIO W0465]USE36078.1 transposase [Endozoicomonas sp. SCSIO W0465]USE38920.1 transposase [Endozoicomonas sp. SCSIO W0465]
MLPLSPKPWSELTFGCADLGDTRRTKRLGTPGMGMN